MPVLAIEINDVGLRAARSGAGNLLALEGEDGSSPGFACLEKKGIITGAAAAARACVRPLATHNRFWDQLGTEPVTTGASSAPTRAAVAIAHLRQALTDVGGADDDVVMAVPPTYDQRQLGVLVSMAREVGLNLRGLVPGPVGLDHEDGASGPVLVVETSLHRTALSIIDVGPQVVLGRVEPCPGIGLDAFRRQWINAIGAEFVRKTRFDPLHDAGTEQQLHDRLPDILAAVLREESIAIELEAGAHVHRVTITALLLAQAGQGLVFDLGASVQKLVAFAGVRSIAMTHDTARIPGLEAMLRRQGAPPFRTLPPGAAALGLCRHWPDRFEQPESAGVAYHTWRQG